ncbi:hypothetical protein ACJX0J_001991 [Zea mays]
MKVQERILNLYKKRNIIENMGQKIIQLGSDLEDKKIRNCIKNYIQKNRKKGSNRKMESDSSSEKKGAIEELEKDLQKEVNSVNQRLNIAIEKVKEPYRQPNILAEYIFHSEKQMKKAIELTKKADIKGIKSKLRGLLGVKIWIFNLVFPKSKNP